MDAHLTLGRQSLSLLEGCIFNTPCYVEGRSGDERAIYALIIGVYWAVYHVIYSPSRVLRESS